jgi:hypothetical protein
VRFAYADPPYPGKARSTYGDHADFGGEVDHEELISTLEADYDGWALSTSAKALPMILRLCPPMEPNPKQPGDFKTGTGVRVLSWHKRLGRPGTEDITNAWEPVILRGYRRPPKRGWRPKDCIDVCPELYTMRLRPDDYVVGKKPPAFCRWLFECAGLTPRDEFVDLFPGSGGVLREWETWCSQPQLRAAGSPAARSPESELADLRENHPRLEIES